MILCPFNFECTSIKEPRKTLPCTHPSPRDGLNLLRLNDRRSLAVGTSNPRFDKQKLGLRENPNLPPGGKDDFRPKNSSPSSSMIEWKGCRIILVVVVDDVVGIREVVRPVAGADGRGVSNSRRDERTGHDWNEWCEYTETVKVVARQTVIHVQIPTIEYASRNCCDVPPWISRFASILFSRHHFPPTNHMSWIR